MRFQGGVTADFFHAAHGFHDPFAAGTDFGKRCRQATDSAGHIVDLLPDGCETFAGVIHQRHALFDVRTGFANRFDHILNIGVVDADDSLDLLSGAFRLFRQFSHFLGHDGEASALLASSRRFDRRIQCQ